MAKNMKNGTLKISGKRHNLGANRMRGQELQISLIDEDGNETAIRAMSLELKCDGRKDYVEAIIRCPVSEIDVEVPMSQVEIMQSSNEEEAGVKTDIGES